MSATTLPAARRRVADRCCAPVTGGVLDDEAAAELARVFKALGDPTRVRLLSLIAAGDGRRGLRLRPHRARRALPAHRVPPHAQLVDAGLISREQRGKWAYYRVVKQTLGFVSSALAPVTAA